MKSLEELALEFCVFELRYNPSPMIWDAAGAIWTSAIAANPSLAFALAQPNQQVFETDSLQLTLDITTLRVIGRGENALAEVSRNASLLLKIISEKLKLQTFTRAGLRIIRSKVFESSPQALKAAAVSIDEESPAFGKDARKVGFAKNTRFETDESGLLASLRVEEREFSFTIPWESRPRIGAKLNRKEWVVVSDLDYYTVGKIDREVFDVETWLRQAVKKMEREWSAI